MNTQYEIVKQLEENSRQIQNLYYKIWDFKSQWSTWIRLDYSFIKEPNWDNDLKIELLKMKQNLKARVIIAKDLKRKLKEYQSKNT